MRDSESARDGWQALADYVGCSMTTIVKRKKELMRCGVIFERWKGRPKRKIISWFPSTVRDYIALLSSQGKKF